MEMNSRPRWLISMTPMPLPCQSSISAAACRSTSSGIAAGPAEKLNGRCRLKVEEVVKRHCASPHRVLMVGFAPGHPYIGGLDPRLSVPRRTTPRPIVTAGSVAIANTQSVVYPWTISGGWSVIGRSPLRFFDPQRDPPAVFAPGDRVHFVAIGRSEYDRLGRESARDAAREPRT